MKTYLESLILENYRNIEKASLTFDKDLTILYGDNAQGKTNAVESVYLFATGKSFRSARDRDLLKFGCEKAQIDLSFYDNIRKNELCYRFYAEEIGKKREIFVNHIKMKSVSHLVGHFHAVLFCPEHLSLVRDEPSLRRNFLDHAICQLKPTYMMALNEYAKIVEQRNALLRDFENYSESQFQTMATVLSESFSDSAAFITVTRARYLEKLFHFADSYMKDMTLGKENLFYQYINSIKDEFFDCTDFKAVKNRYYEKLNNNLEKEKAAGTSLYGPHRDDFSILLNEKSAKLFASQGQQRSIALALKLAEGELSKEYTGAYPVFLLDDVLSELDRKRKDYILSGFGDRQIVITTCDKNDFNQIENAMKIEVKNGTFHFSSAVNE